MRRALLATIPLALLLAGCGGTTITPTPETVIGTVPKSAQPSAPKLPKGDATRGKAVFASAGCGGCHTLKAAGSTGTVGPNLDQLKPDLVRIETQVINGGGPMPPYKGQLTDQQIADVSQFVYTATHS
jgi:mono/diheme cytochrome c family protein